MKKINFISLLDIEKKELGILIDRAIELKDMVKQNIVYTPLQNKTLALVFDKSSTRIGLNVPKPTCKVISGK